MDDLLGISARRALGETRRCTATNRAGERCKRAAVRGGFVCNMHGGNAPQTRRAAERRLLAIVDPAIEVLEAAMRQAPPCPHCGRSDADRDPAAIRAAQIALDRAGFHPSLTVKHVRDEDPVEDWVDYLTEEQVSVLGTWISEAEARARAGIRPEVPEPLALPPGPVVAIDGVLVDEGEEEGSLPEGN